MEGDSGIVTVQEGSSQGCWCSSHSPFSRPEYCWGIGSRKLAHRNCPDCPHCPLEKCNDVHHVPCRRLPICSLHKHSDAYKCSQAAWPWERAVLLRKAPQRKTTPINQPSALGMGTVDFLSWGWRMGFVVPYALWRICDLGRVICKSSLLTWV